MKKTIEIQLCPICEEAIEGYHPNGTTIKKRSMEGLVLVFGGSHGGWGLRYDDINISDEVCSECFNKIKTKMREVEQLIESLKPKKKVKKFLGIPYETD